EDQKHQRGTRIPHLRQPMAPPILNHGRIQKITRHHGSEPAIPASWRGTRNPRRVVGFRIEFRLLGPGIHTGGMIASVPSLSAETSLYRESGQYRQTTERSSPPPRTTTVVTPDRR